MIPCYKLLGCSNAIARREQDYSWIELRDRVEVSSFILRGKHFKDFKEGYVFKASRAH